MELWVRSQDKTTLIKCSEIYIAEEKSYLIKEASSSHILGAYKTIDRALEVLDEIQRHLIWLLTFEYRTREISSYMPEFVYEMPLE
jgi:hypothetical protein